MKKAPLGKGFWLSFLINFAFRYFWGVLFLLLLAAHFIFKVPLWVVFIPLVCWFLHAFILTLVLSLIARIPSSINDPRPNKNPYSKGYSTREQKQAGDDLRIPDEALPNDCGTAQDKTKDKYTD